MTEMQHLSHEHVDTIVEEIWNAFIGLQIQPAHELVEGDAPSGGALDGQVEISGAWEGSVVVTCPPELARRATTTLLGLEPTSPEEVIDVLAEVANITGGNLKALLPGPTTLSTPVVGVHVPRGADTTTYTYRCEGETFAVTLLPPAARTTGTSNGERS